MGGVLNRLGVDFGDKLFQAQQGVNEKGFWEHGPIVNCHNELLLNLGSSWDDPRPLPEGWQDLGEIQTFRRHLRNIVTRDFEKSPLWGMKDPRMCRLLPLWKDIFETLPVNPKYLIMVRNPLEVAASLAKRDGFSLDKALFLWWQHQALAELGTRGYTRIFVAYQDLLHQPENTVARICAKFELPLSRNAIPAITAFLAPSLRHHKDLSFEGGSKVVTEVETAYRVSMRAASLEAHKEPLEEIREQTEAFFAHYRSLNPILLEHMAIMAREAREAHRLYRKYYDCFAVKIAKRFCILGNYLKSMLVARD